MSADDHGSYSTYTNHSCRCEACRAANTAKQRDRRVARRRELSEGSVVLPHGSESTYTNWGCRCDYCRQAHARYQRESRARVS